MSGDEDNPTKDAPGLDRAGQGQPSYRRLYAGLAIMAALFLIVAGVFIGSLLPSGGSTAAEKTKPAPSTIDVGFLRDMQTHHSQAVEMSVMVRDRTDDEEVRQVALDIELTQQQQIGQMYGLLASWNQSQNNPSPMSWMTTDTGGSSDDDTHSGMSGMSDMPGASDAGAGDSASAGVMAMPGMASAADLQRLASLRGRPAERLFLELMIAHHEGGLPMAKSAEARASEPWVRTLARSIVEAQTSELTALRTMLDARGGPLG
ncbi:DUF305 domain-containing protein [Nocardioides sp. TRM66260-LWL]|uniref:DUF305 domain-containing protein n=1 Tax=Nocardioides sp. TRM66260-LWL TaxID=2874478 RepID=UPI001CC6F3F7|nr:DUF305 domain-containing protein [Nocardioides sp. TRM66260-LWL]MBZ5733514.1 DUF305 domain-containing protein [Nocardioides sp. TRM66260-LWL]